VILRRHIHRLLTAIMVLFFAPMALAASSDVVLCLEINGQASLERGIGEDCTGFVTEITAATNLTTAQHCNECTDYALSDSVFRVKATSADSGGKTVQKLFIAERSALSWPRLSVSSLIAATPPLLRMSITLAQLRTVIIRV
jgi:hypothetical protein